MGILNMRSKSVAVMFLILVPTCLCSLADKAEAALACYNCHGTKSTMDIRPEDASCHQE